MTKRENILVVENEEDIRELITYNLENEDYKVDGVESRADDYRDFRFETQL